MNFGDFFEVFHKLKKVICGAPYSVIPHTFRWEQRGMAYYRFACNVNKCFLLTDMWLICEITYKSRSGTDATCYGCIRMSQSSTVTGTISVQTGNAWNINRPNFMHE